MSLPLRIPKSIITLGIAALATTGCTVGPDYHAPTMTLPGTWIDAPPAPQAAATTAIAAATGTEASETASSQPSVSRTVAGQPDVRAWWKSFNDATLDNLIALALASNLDIGQAEARIRAARSERVVAGAPLWPSVTANARAARSEAGVRNGATITSLYRAGFDAAWELDVFGGTRRNVEAATADLQAAIEDRNDVIVTLTAEIATTYFDLRGAQRQLAIAQQNLQSQQESVELTKKRKAGGFVSQLDVANAQAQVAATEARIPDFESAVHVSIHALGVLLGEEPGGLMALQQSAPQPVAPPEVPVGLPSDLLRRRPDIRRAEAQLHAATARIGVATADLFPKFSLTGSLGISGSQLSALGNASNSFWSIGPEMTWPIFAGGQIRANIDVQRALTDESSLAYRQTVLTALQEVEDALTTFANEQTRRTALIDAVRSTREAVDLATQLYQVGRTDFLNVLTAQRGLLDAEDALAQSDTQIISDLVALYKALGGGWEEIDDASQPDAAVTTSAQPVRASK